MSRQAQVAQDELEQRIEIEMRVKDEDRMDGALQIAHEFTQQRGLSCSHLTGDDDEGLFGFDPVMQDSHDLLIEGIDIEEARVWSDTKG